MKKRFFLPVLLAALCACNAAVPTPTPTPAPAVTPTVEAQPADALTLEEKVGQLFIVRPDALDLSLSQETINDAKADGVTAVTNDMRRALQQYPVGGICQFGKNIESPSQLVRFNKELQDASATPLFIAVDEEGGLVARLANNDAFTLPRYASAAAVGASGDPEDARAMGQTIGAYLKEVEGNGFMAQLKADGKVSFTVDGSEVVLEMVDVLVDTAEKDGFVSSGDNNLTVVLDTNLIPELVEEGFVREIVSKVQTMRKEADFNVTDRIRVYYDGNAKIAEILAANDIKGDVLAVEVVAGKGGELSKEWNINGEKVTLGVARV